MAQHRSNIVSDLVEWMRRRTPSQHLSMRDRYYREAESRSRAAERKYREQRRRRRARRRRSRRRR